MAVSGIMIIFSLAILVVFVVGGVLLQIFLSKRENKWLGLILPAICIMFSLIAVLSIPTFSVGQVRVQETLQDGTVVERHSIEQETVSITDKADTLFMVATVFVIFNIPTIVLMLIYFGCRKRFKINREIDKMNIQDLE